METKHIETPQDVLGRMFYQIREKKERTMRMHLFFYTIDAFDNAIQLLGGIEAMKYAMLNGHISITAGDTEVLEYITNKLSDEDNNKAVGQEPASQEKDL
jgi:hypothetical protein